MNVLLNVILFLPAAGALFLLLLSSRRSDAIRWTALTVVFTTFVLSVPLAFRFDAASASMQFATNLVWLKSPATGYHIAVDGISLFLVILTAFLNVLSVLISWRAVSDRMKQFFFFLLLLETATIGVFVAMDLLLFYVFWGVALIPMYFLIGIWGHQRRILAAAKFFLYTMTGSLLMLLGILWVGNRFGTFDYEAILALLSAGSTRFTSVEQMWLFLAFFAAFAIQVPLFPLHTWLPDAHVEAPAAGSVILAGVLLKTGAYGLLRFCLPLFPDAAHALAPAIIALTIVGIIYGSLLALVQTDLNRLIAYSSVAQLGFVVLGIFSFNAIAVQGAVYQMLSHGVTTGALFLLVGMIYERIHTRDIAEMGGLATPAPAFALLFFIATLSSIGMPLLGNFVGEFLILLGVLQERAMDALLAATGIVLSAAYMLWMYQRVFLGEARPEHARFPDLGFRERVILASSVAVMLYMGVASPFFLDRMNTATAGLLDRAGSREIRVEMEGAPNPMSRARYKRPAGGQLPESKCPPAGPISVSNDAQPAPYGDEGTTRNSSITCYPTI